MAWGAPILSCLDSFAGDLVLRPCAGEQCERRPDSEIKSRRGDRDRRGERNGGPRTRGPRGARRRRLGLSLLQHAPLEIGTGLLVALPWQQSTRDVDTTHG